jgi:hypothetical protein
VSPPPQIIEKRNFVQLNNKLYILSSFSSSSSSSFFRYKKYQFKHHYHINNPDYVSTVRLPLLNACIAYYNKFINQDFSITEDLTMEFILLALLNNTAVIAFIICRNEVTSLLFKNNSTSGYVDDKLDQQISLNIEKQKCSKANR